MDNVGAQPVSVVESGARRDADETGQTTSQLHGFVNKFVKVNT